MDYVRKNNVTHQVGTKIPSAYPSSKVTYGNNSNVEGELVRINADLSVKTARYATSQDITLNSNGFATVASITDFGLTVSDVPRVKGVFIVDMGNQQSVVMVMLPASNGLFTVAGTPNSVVKRLFTIQIIYN